MRHRNQTWVSSVTGDLPLDLSLATALLPSPYDSSFKLTETRPVQHRGDDVERDSKCFW